MTKASFKAEVAMLLDTESAKLSPETVLASVGTWDSVAQLSFIAMAMDHFSTPPRPDNVARCETYGDLEALYDRELIE